MIVRRMALIAVCVVLVAGASACKKADPAPVPPAPLTPGQATGLDAAALVEQKCNGACHDMERIDAYEGDALEWEMVLDRMAANGAEVAEDERTAIAEYLSLR